MTLAMTGAMTRGMRRGIWRPDIEGDCRLVQSCYNRLRWVLVVSSAPKQGARMGWICKAFLVILALGLMTRAAGAQQAAAQASYDQSGVVLEKDVLPGAPKIVLIAGSRSHGPGDHEFFAGTAILQKMLKQNGVNGVMARDGWPKDETIFEGAKSVMIFAD